MLSAVAWLSRVGWIAVLMAILALGGCVTLRSERLVVDAGRFVYPVPEGAWLHSYSVKQDGTLTHDPATARQYRMNGVYYEAGPSDPVFAFSPLAKDFYLLVVQAGTYYRYGFARMDGNVVQVDLTLSEAADRLAERVLPLLPQQVADQLRIDLALSNDGNFPVETLEVLSVVGNLYFSGDLKFNRQVYVWSTDGASVPASLPARLLAEPRTLAQPTATASPTAPAGWIIDDRRDGAGQGPVLAHVFSTSIEGAEGLAALQLGCAAYEPGKVSVMLQFPNSLLVSDATAIPIVQTRIAFDGDEPMKLVFSPADLPNRAVSFMAEDARRTQTALIGSNLFDLSYQPEYSALWLPDDFVRWLEASSIVEISVSGADGAEMRARFAVDIGNDVLAVLRAACPAP